MILILMGYLAMGLELCSKGKKDRPRCQKHCEVEIVVRNDFFFVFENKAFENCCESNV